VKAYLEASDVMVYMTRKEDEGLYENEDANKKVRDMQKRIAIIEEHKPDICVSIHQNSFPDSGTKGAQVFYYTGSKAGKTLAESVQKQLREVLDPTNKRQVKADDSYYLLKKTVVPLVIVECGFLSNPTEAAKLCDEAYQDRVAWAIHIGIMRYLNT
jgi:N-acetylmuramoyl-L-alanine amidase